MKKEASSTKEVNTKEAAGKKDSGVYIVWIGIKNETDIAVGALGEKTFAPGFYAYTGSAQKNRTARLLRHLKLEKPLRWHIDYLRPYGDVAAVHTLPGTKDEECKLAARLTQEAGGIVSVPRFGASDCRCPGHLIYFPSPPDCLFNPALLHPEAVLWHP